MIYTTPKNNPPTPSQIQQHTSSLKYINTTPSKIHPEPPANPMKENSYQSFTKSRLEKIHHFHGKKHSEFTHTNHKKALSIDQKLHQSIIIEKVKNLNLATYGTGLYARDIPTDFPEKTYQNEKSYNNQSPYCKINKKEFYHPPDESLKGSIAFYSQGIFLSKERKFFKNSYKPKHEISNRNCGIRIHESRGISPINNNDFGGYHNHTGTTNSANRLNSSQSDYINNNKAILFANKLKDYIKNKLTKEDDDKLFGGAIPSNNELYADKKVMINLPSKMKKFEQLIYKPKLNIKQHTSKAENSKKNAINCKPKNCDRDYIKDSAGFRAGQNKSGPGHISQRSLLNSWQNETNSMNSNSFDDVDEHIYQKPDEIVNQSKNVTSNTNSTGNLKPQDKKKFEINLSGILKSGMPNPTNTQSNQNLARSKRILKTMKVDISYRGRSPSYSKLYVENTSKDKNNKLEGVQELNYGQKLKKLFRNYIKDENNSKDNLDKIPLQNVLKRMSNEQPIEEKLAANENSKSSKEIVFDGSNLLPRQDKVMLNNKNFLRRRAPPQRIDSKHRECIKLN